MPAKILLWLRDDSLGAFCWSHAEKVLNEHGPFLDARYLDEPGGVSVVEQLCYLRIEAATPDGDFEPDEVTALLGLQPTRVQRRGEHRSDDGVRYPRWTRWAFELPRRFEVDTEVLVRQLLDAVEPVAPGLERVRASPPVQADVVLAQYMHGYMYDFEDGDPPSFTATTPALAFESETLRRLAVLKLGLDIDQYV